jgi:hypothetical protein
VGEGFACPDPGNDGQIRFLIDKGLQLLCFLVRQAAAVFAVFQKREPVYPIFQCSKDIHMFTSGKRKTEGKSLNPA